MSSLRQSSFARGEITDDLYGRVDQQIYGISVHTARNFTPGRFGQIDNRPGSQFLGRTRFASAQVRLIPFVFSQSQSYVLEFGNQYFRVWKSGAQITETGVSITAISKAASCQITAANTYSAGDELILSGIGGMTELNGRNVLVSATGLTVAHFQITDLDGNAINSTNFTTYTSGGTASRVYTVTTPYVTADLPQLNYAQSADVLSIVHPTYPPADVARASDASWTLTTTVFKPSLDGPTVTFATGSGAAGTMTYQVTSVKSSNLEESLPGLGTPVTIEAYTLTASTNTVNIKITGHGLTSGNTVSIATTDTSRYGYLVTCAGAGNPVVFTSVAHGMTIGDTLRFLSVANPAVVPFLNVDPTGSDFVISNTTADTFSVTGLTGTSAFSIGPFFVRLFTVYQPYLATYGSQTWVITRIGADNFTLNGTTVTLTLQVTSSTFGTSSSNAVTHALSGAPTTANPNILTWTTVAGAGFYNVYVLVNGLFCFIGTTSTLTFSDTGLTPDLLSNPPIPGNPFNSSGNYPAVVGYYQQRRVYANTNNAVATAWMSRPGAYANFSTNSPLVASDSISFTLSSTEVNAIRGIVDLRKLVVFTLGGEWSVEGVAGSSISAVQGVDARQSSYNGASTLRPLVVNANGLYVQAQTSMVRDIIWKFQDDNFGGEERSIYSNHLVQGYTIGDWAYQKVPYSTVWAVRSDGVLLSYTYLREQEVFGWAHHDWLGSVTGTGGNMTTTAATVENVCSIPEGGETALYLSIKRTINSTTVRYVERLQSRLVSNLLDCAYMDARLSYDGRTGGTTTSRITGLWHLVGQSVSVIADGVVIANPLDSRYSVLTVAADGTLTLPAAAQVVHIGIPFVSDLETQDPEIMESETLMNKRVSINSVSLFVKKSLGGWIGPGGAPADTSQTGLSQVSVIDSDGNAPASGSTFTGKLTTPIEAVWDNKGRVLVRQIDPLPITILSLAINGNFPTRQKGT